MRKKIILSVFAAVAFIFVAAPLVFAASSDQVVPCGGPGQKACTICDFFEMARRATDYVIFKVIPVLVALAAVIGGGYYFLSRGNPDELNRAKKTIEIAIGGFLFVFVGWLFLNTFFMAIGTAEWNGFSLSESWWKISATCSWSREQSGYCGDGILQADEACDPEMTIEACQGRYGMSEQRCTLIKSKCKPRGDENECTAEYCGDGIVQEGELCDPQQSVANCMETTDKTNDECVKFIGSCTRDCKIIEKEVEEPEDDITVPDEDSPPYDENRCFEMEVPGPHIPDCPEIHSGLDGYTLVKKDFYVAPGAYHSSALSPISAKGPNGEKICMCFDACAYTEKFKYVMTNAEKRLFDVYASEAGKLAIQMMGEYSALMDDTKPVIYLYPETETQVKVTIEPKGKMTASIPAYGNGWDVSVLPGSVIDKQYGYLFYETEIPLSELSVPAEGYSVEYADLENFFDALLPKIGLQGKEITDFKEWWLNGRLKQANYYTIKLLEPAAINDAEAMKVSPNPDTVIRIRFLFEPTDKKTEIIAPVIATPQRNGFTVVEWGGLLEKER